MKFNYRNPQVLFHGKRVDMMSIDVEYPNQGIVSKEVVDHPGAVVILPFLDEKHVLLIRNERPTVQQTLWELPAGTLEKEEEPLICAGRELIEETGYKAAHIEPLLDFFSTPGFCNEILYGYLATDLEYIGQNLDDTENIVCEVLLFSRALEMIKEGVIFDAKTICLLLYFAAYRQR